jgi:hypothetical protein
MLKFTYKGHFFDIWKIPILKIQMVGTCFGAPSIHRILIFGGISKFLEVIVIGQILAVLGKFCCISNGSQHAQTSVEIFKTL